MIELPKDFSYQPIKKEKSIETLPSILSIKNMNFKYKTSEDNIIDNLNLEIKKGEFIGIAGPSGCGKTSLIKVITKLEKAEGIIKINGINIDSLTRKDIAKEIGIK